MNQTINLALVLDIKLDSGGALHMAQSQIFFLQKLKKFNKNLNISLIITNKELFLEFKKNYNFKVFFYNKKNFFIKLLNYLYKKIIQYIVIDSHFEFFLKKKKINLVYFSSPSYLVLLFRNLNFIYTVFDLVEKKLENLSEHKESIISIRNKCYKHSAIYADKIFITNDQRKKIFINNYNCQEEKVFTIQFPPSLCSPKIESKKVVISFLNKKVNSYMLYPAQYWSHKNHSYIIKSMSRFRSSHLKNLGCIFTGNDKGYLSYLQILAKKQGVEEKIIFFNYLSNNQLVYLYNNSFCVLFPSLIGFDSFPLYESFYFKKMIIYNQYLIDKSYKNNVISLDIKKFDDLERKLLYFNQYKKHFKKKVSTNLQFYKKIFFQNENYFYNLLLK
jgi:glycosyltransferase involved in cell wall biosynthesis